MAELTSMDQRPESFPLMVHRRRAETVRRQRQRFTAATALRLTDSRIATAGSQDFRLCADSSTEISSV